MATLYRRILATPGIEHRYDLASLRGANSTGEPLEDSVRTEWESALRLPDLGALRHLRSADGDRRRPGIPKREGSIGRTWGARAAVLDDELNELPAGSVGTLAFASDYPGFFLGYLGDEERTRATLRGGWFVTSDLARMDADGYVFIVGRADDCFKSKGVLIAPREVEEAILGLGAFEEACVFPIPDGEIGNRIGAASCHARTARMRRQRRALAGALSGRIAPFKLPHRVVVLPNCPKTPTARRNAARSRVSLLSRWRRG